MNKKAGISLMLIGAMLILSALGVLIYNSNEAKNADRASAEALSKLNNTIDDSADEASTQMKTIDIDGYSYIGTLLIPSIDVELPVMSAWDYSKLKIAPCRYYGSVLSNDMVIAAHNYKRHFGNLSKLEVGDNVCFKDVDGKSYSYQVASIEVLSQTATDEMVSSGFDLSLYTCTYGARERITVRCQQITE